MLPLACALLQSSRLPSKDVIFIFPQVDALMFRAPMQCLLHSCNLSKLIHILQKTNLFIPATLPRARFQNRHLPPARILSNEHLSRAMHHIRRLPPTRFHCRPSPSQEVIIDPPPLNAATIKPPMQCILLLGDMSMPLPMLPTTTLSIQKIRHGNSLG
ncbi:hypothetical protein KP509_30G045200 [Ceratopteris richardii]|uniref:Uncharacterized protein n=1 Tax=Ceratopteris richardii TaxID=49495 RepID=A0A8T2R1X3_CERRI|nr:hypothetical protein KP509_1Z096500 [Ceratopteris richardii]KAH6557759.1 hypothetical protein KP509_1Z096800 [Ceratopteris richardii]KAH7290372.1 hypothetical protein KP509_30G045200 [Ceratopteris richardii]